MSVNSNVRSTASLWRWLVSLGLLALACATAIAVATNSGPVEVVGEALSPSVAFASSEPLTLTCRLGYAVLSPIENYEPSLLTSLRGGTYVNYATAMAPAQPMGIEHIQVIRVHQNKTGVEYNSPYVVPYTYTVWPDWSALPAYVQSNPGAIWVVGNEPDRRDWETCVTTPVPTCATLTQDEIVPELYAQAYHEIYNIIKSVDPTARVANGGLVQATPLRLQYLDQVWTAYRAQYDANIPVDVWNMHEFILPEYADRTQFGAGVPSGINAPGGGIIYSIADVVNPTIYSQHLLAMRTWMAGKGERNKPLLLSERGVMPDWLNDDRSVSYFITTTLDYTLNYTNASIGHPLDGNRLVQGMVWYSLDDDTRDSEGYLIWGGHLINSASHTLDPLGQTWYNYVQYRMPQSRPDLLPTRAWQVMSPFTQTDFFTATVVVDVVNKGNIGSGQPVSVTLRDENGNDIASATMSALGGCVMVHGQVTFTVTSLTAGSHDFSVWVDPANSVIEDDKANNVLPLTLVVGANRIYLPITLRGN